MEGKKKITVCFLVLVFMMGTCFRIPVQAAGLEKQSNVNVAQIKTSKKTQRTGKSFRVQILFQSDVHLEKVKIEYAGSGLKTYKVNMKSVNKEKTKWKADISINKSMKKGIFGIKKIYVTGKNVEGRKVKSQIRNNRWCVEHAGWSYETDQNLSAGNVKIIS